MRAGVDVLRTNIVSIGLTIVSIVQGLTFNKFVESSARELRLLPGPEAMLEPAGWALASLIFLGLFLIARVLQTFMTAMMAYEQTGFSAGDAALLFPLIFVVGFAQYMFFDNWSPENWRAPAAWWWLFGLCLVSSLNHASLIFRAGRLIAMPDDEAARERRLQGKNALFAAAAAILSLCLAKSPGMPDALRASLMLCIGTAMGWNMYISIRDSFFDPRAGVARDDG